MTKEELLNCLTDRPCSVCKFKKENGCSKWKCVFEEKSDEIRADNKMNLRRLIELFLDGDDDIIYIDVYEGNEFNQLYHDVRIISSCLSPYYNREVIALSEGYDTLLSVIIGKECEHE